ncbi:hypothetical protein ACOI1H_15640 [Loktanella sp. DJP18]|uniref:hypothetical protein n=1 Tax=Loktanella sp. DJP18 TaxID=3409788 RepID=UPI003BB5E83B
MKFSTLIASLAAAALVSLPLTVEAQGKGNGNGNGGNGKKTNVAQGNGHGRGNNNGNSNARGHDGTANARPDRPGKQADLSSLAAGLIAANGVIYLTPDVDFTTITDDELLAIANCPPGLAKKDPPCVPPGLARQGVAFDEWASYDPEALRGLLDERFVDIPQTDAPVPLDLTQDRIEDLFGLDPAPEGYRYAIIDGRPVQLNAADYDRLLTLNSLATRPTLADGTAIVPDEALTQDQLIARYGLPALADGQNYAVLDNRIIALPDQSYDLLQLIRILGAV